MTKPRLLDLFCGAGGAAVGYSRAGFEVMGVDINPQPHYPFEFLKADALNLSPEWTAANFDAIHASPPCQAYSTQGRSSRWGTPPSSPPLIAATQRLLDETNLPFVIENVPGARRDLREPMISLRGHQFGLGVDRLRYFELGNWYMLQHPFDRRPKGLVLGVYGQRPDGRRLAAGRTHEQLRAPRSVEEAQVAMGIDWCPDWRGVAEAIPPAYTQFVGEQLLAHIQSEKAPSLD